MGPKILEMKVCGLGAEGFGMATAAGPLVPQHGFKPPLPHSPENEELRMETLSALGISGDSFPRDPMLTAMCKTIAKLLDVPIAGISIVQDKQLHMRAVIGIPEDFSCARDGAFCSWTLLPRKPEVLIVEDTLKDARFSELDVVKGPAALRFYAGAPLLASNGTRLGAVCIFDVKPRKMKAEEYNMLSNFSEIAIRRLEERDFKKLKGEINREMQREELELSQAVVLCDVSASRWWGLLYCNDAFTRCTGVSIDTSNDTESNFWKMFRPAQAQTKSKLQDEIEEDIQAGRDFTLTVTRRDSSNKHAFKMNFRPATTANLSGHATSISVPNIVAAAEIGESSSSYYFATVKPVEQLTAERLTETQQGAPRCSVKMLSSSMFMLNQQETAEHPRQATFFSKGHEHKHGIRAADGMRDVTMGVLCSNSPDGLVYRARWRKRSVAVRVIEARLSECSQFPEFGDVAVPSEAAVSLDLVHPNIAATYKIVVEDSPNVSAKSRKMVLAWMVREWCGKGSLSDALQRGWMRDADGKIKMAAVLAVAKEIAAALSYMHASDIVHGDLNPDSVLLQDDREFTAGKHKDFIAKVTDFSLSIRPDDLTASSKLGSASHAAPELLSQGEKSKATDVYAFGMLLWEAYMGQVVWPSLNLSQLHRRVVAAKERPPMPDDMPLGLKDLIESCLENDATLRPQFTEIIDTLRRLAQEEAAGQLVYALAVPPERKSSKLFKLDSKKTECKKEPTQPPVEAEAKGKQQTAQPTTKSLFRRLMPGLK